MLKSIELMSDDENSADNTEEQIDTTTLEQKFLSINLALWKRSWPLLVSRLTKSGFSFWGMRLLAEQGGPLYNAAETPINAAKTWFSISINTAFTPANILISQLHTHQTKRGRIINACIGSLLQAGVAGGVIMLVMDYVPNILQTFGQPADAVRIAGDFFSFYKFIAIPACLNAGATQILTALDDTTPISIITILSSALALPLQYGWIQGKLGFNQELAIGLGKVIAVEGSISALGLLTYLTYKIIRHRELRDQFSVKKSLRSFAVQALFGVGICLIAGVELSSMFAISMFIGTSLSARDMGLFNVVMSYVELTLPVLFALRSTTTSMIGNIRGLKTYLLNHNQHTTLALESNAKKTIAASAVNGTAIALLQLIIYVAAAPLLIFGFTNFDSQLIDDLRILFLIVCISQIIDALRNVYNAGLYGNNNILIPLISSIIFILGLNLGLTKTALALDFGLVGIAVSGLVTTALDATGLGLWWHQKEIHTFSPQPLQQENLFNNCSALFFRKTETEPLLPNPSAKEEDHVIPAKTR